MTFAHETADSGALAQAAVRDGFAAPSSTVLRGRTVLRMCTINPRTTDADIDATIARLTELARGVESSA